MQISSLVELVGGELKNSPSISRVYDIKTEVKKVHEGDLFFLEDTTCLQEAIDKSVFAIIYSDTRIAISDNEIAWIFVDDLYRAALKLARYFMLSKQVISLHVNNVLFDMIGIYKNDFKSKVYMPYPSIQSLLYTSQEIQDNEYLFSNDADLIYSIYPQTQAFESHQYTLKNLTKHSLFETSFSYKQRFFSRVKIPEIYVKDFLTLSQEYIENIDETKLRRFSCFKPIFIDKYLNRVEFGKSDRFILCCSDIVLAFEEISYLVKNYTHAESIILLPHTLESTLGDKVFFYKDTKQIKEVLKNEFFNAVYIVGKSDSEIMNLLDESETQNSLF